MKPTTTIWQKMGLHDWFLNKEMVEPTHEVIQLTPNDVFKYIVEKFHESISQLSFASRIVFYHEYIVCLNAEDYNEFMNNKKGIFGLIIHESVKKFYEELKGYREKGKTVEPSSNKWVFRFVSHPDYGRGDKSFIGKLLPNAVQQREENLRVTFIPRQTGIAESFDISDEILKDFTFYSEGYYEVPFQDNFIINDDEANLAEKAKVLARFETIIPDREYAGRKIEYLMKDTEIIVTGKDDDRDGKGIFKIPSEWVNSPHLRIRYHTAENNFYVASFGEKTMLNEVEMPQSETDNLQWMLLPFNSKLVLNGIVGINIFKALT